MNGTSNLPPIWVTKHRQADSTPTLGHNDSKLQNYYCYVNHLSAQTELPLSGQRHHHNVADEHPGLVTKCNGLRTCASPSLDPIMQATAQGSLIEPSATPPTQYAASMPGASVTPAACEDRSYCPNMLCSFAEHA